MMPELTIRLRVSAEQAEIYAQMEAMVLFLTPNQKNILRATIGGIHDYTKQVRHVISTLDQILETEGTNEPRIAAAIAQLREPAREAVDVMDHLRTTLGGAVFARPGANGETLQ